MGAVLDVKLKYVNIAKSTHGTVFYVRLTVHRNKFLYNKTN